MGEDISDDIRNNDLGDISTRRDWGHSKDYVRGIWMILQHKKAEDWVLSTGKNYSIEDFVKKVFKILNLDWKKFVTTNNKIYLRPWRSADVFTVKRFRKEQKKQLFRISGQCSGTRTEIAN